MGEQESTNQIAAYRYSGPHGAECVVDTQGQSFFGYAAVSLDGGEYALSNGTAPASPSRCDVIIDACEGLIAWCSAEKERGSKKHRRQAEEVQAWALDLVSKTRAERDAADVDAQTGTADDQWTDVAPIRTALQTSATSPVPQLFPLDRLHESPLNPRQYIPEASIEELASSMRQSGFRAWLPIVARLRSDGDGEIAAGHRRRLAAIRAGLTQVPVLLQEMTDEEFLDILNFDNAGREDVHPLHEAAGWRTWMEKTGKGVLDIAGRIGQSKEYVYQRLKYAALTVEAAAAFLDNKFTAAHAILVARQTPEVQKKALEYLKPGYDSRIPSSRQLEGWLHQSYQDLKDAKFDRDDAMLLPGAGPCATCPKRAANDPSYVLPADEAEEEAVCKESGAEYERPDYCMDPRCYQQKFDNHLVRIRQSLEAQGKQVVQVSSDYRKSKKKDVLSTDQYERAGDKDPKAQLALVTDGFHAGELVKIKLRSTPTGASRADQEKARKEQEARHKVETDRELAIRGRILDAVLVKAGGLQRADVELLLVSRFDDNWAEEPEEWLCQRHRIQHEKYRGSAALVKALSKMEERQLFDVVIELSVADEFEEWNVERNEKPEKLLALAKRYKVDAAKIRADFEEAAKEAEGGTRREVIGKLPAVNQPKAKPAAKKAASAKKAAKKSAGNSCSAAARKRIAEAQKKRWAAFKKQQASKKGGEK